MRSSDATVCRLFFTRWWISRIVASLVMSSCSWCRNSVTSRTSTMAPTRSPRWRIGMVRSVTVTPRASMSVRHGARPVTTSGSDSSTTSLPVSSPVVTSASDSPSSSPSNPMRLKRRETVRAGEGHDAVDVEADQTVGCAGRPATRTGWRAEVGEVAARDHREQVVGALVEGELLAARRARLAQVAVPGEHGDRRRRSSPRRSGSAGAAPARRAPGWASPRTSRARRCRRSCAVSNASVTCARHSGLISWPTKSR